MLLIALFLVTSSPMFPLAVSATVMEYFAHRANFQLLFILAFTNNTYFILLVQHALYAPLLAIDKSSITVLDRICNPCDEW